MLPNDRGKQSTSRGSNEGCMNDWLLVVMGIKFDKARASSWRLIGAVSKKPEKVDRSLHAISIKNWWSKTLVYIYLPS
jgi:hypothetical protein